MQHNRLSGDFIIKARRINLQKTNNDLIELCKRGEERGYNLIYAKYSKGIYNTILRIVQHTGEAEDVLQETFVAAFQTVNRLDNGSNFGAWIKRIAINKSLTLLRQRKLSFGEFDEDQSENLQEPDALDEQEFQWKVDVIIKAIDELPKGYRLIVQLHLLENLPQEEVAELLGISHVTVRTQYHRAKKKIMELIKKMEHGKRL